MNIASASLVNSDRLNKTIEQLAAIGKLPNGGVRRIAYSPEDIKARQLVQTWMLDAGMTTRIDAAGNLIGTYAGRKPNAPSLVTGSHIDTVPTGGRYDGTLGVLAGIEVVRVMRENSIQLDHPLEVIVFTDEEGGMIGGKAISGTAFEEADYYRRDDGTAIETCLQRVGGNWSKLQTAQRSQADVAAYLELHVEQGGVLDHEGKEIGVVEGIVGQHRDIVRVKGRPNHAGTTPMNLRQDALVAAAQIVLMVNALAKDTPGQQVATVGALNVFPNAANIVPGLVELTIDMRDIDFANLQRLATQLQTELTTIADRTQTEIVSAPILRTEAVLATPKIQTTIAQVCEEKGFSYCYLPSRASHDAQEMGLFTDMGMIFVPSRAGISHAEDEYTSPEQCAQGVEMLLQVLLRLDRLYGG
ncbi:MAG: Zn-dependent hydrolase [Leptolyngbyaceae cyanobacterium CSU_1_3]|nr:Zn-dependent hydrolase [Leptolyngbyaceae cyanobacterium CSU_1_3]